MIVCGAAVKVAGMGFAASVPGTKAGSFGLQRLRALPAARRTFSPGRRGQCYLRRRGRAVLNRRARRRKRVAQDLGQRVGPGEGRRIGLPSERGPGPADRS